MTRILQEISDTVENLKLGSKVEPLEAPQARAIIKQVQTQLVEGNPRVWWLSFKHKPFFGDPTQPAPEQIRRLLGEETSCYFIPEPEDTNGAVFLTQVGASVDVILDCVYFEYYLVAANLQWVVCENDHNAVICSISPRAIQAPSELLKLQRRQLKS